MASYNWNFMQNVFHPMIYAQKKKKKKKKNSFLKKSTSKSVYSVSDQKCINPLSTHPTKWSNRLKQFVCKSRRIRLLLEFLSVFDHFVGLALRGLMVDSEALEDWFVESYKSKNSFFLSNKTTNIWHFLIFWSHKHVDI